MSDRETEHLRVLIANERKDRLALVAPIVVALGPATASSSTSPPPSSTAHTAQSANSTPTSVPGSTAGTTTLAPSSGPEPPTRSSTRSPATASESTNHDTQLDGAVLSRRSCAVARGALAAPEQGSTPPGCRRDRSGDGADEPTGRGPYRGRTEVSDAPGCPRGRRRCRCRCRPARRDRQRWSGASARSPRQPASRVLAIRARSGTDTDWRSQPSRRIAAASAD